MSNQTTQKTASNKASGAQNVEVLYQKMGNRWFAFSVVGGEVFMGSISQEEIDMLEAQEAAGLSPAARQRTFKVSGNT